MVRINQDIAIPDLRALSLDMHGFFNHSCHWSSDDNNNFQS